MTPDPSGMSAADPKNPTSWNMYMYAGGDPVNFNDPTGLDCATSGFYFNGQYQGTVGDIISAQSNVSILATAMYTESGHGNGVDATDEEQANGAVIMNRWQFVNQNWYLSASPGGPSITNLGWGAPVDNLTSIVENPSQFAIYVNNGNGGVSLSTSAQNNLNSALNSSADSSGCGDLAWALDLAFGMWGSRDNHGLWLLNGLVPIDFNSLGHSTLPYVQTAGSFGDANTFYGVPVGDVSETPIAPPRHPRPIRPPGAPPRRQVQ
jgi:hypothetical protein